MANDLLSVVNEGPPLFRDRFNPRLRDARFLVELSVGSMNIFFWYLLKITNSLLRVVYSLSMTLRKAPPS